MLSKIDDVDVLFGIDLKSRTVFEYHPRGTTHEKAMKRINEQLAKKDKALRGYRLEPRPCPVPFSVASNRMVLLFMAVRRILVFWQYDKAWQMTAANDRKCWRYLGACFMFPPADIQKLPAEKWMEYNKIVSSNVVGIDTSKAGRTSHLSA